jgi:hypothetical protein
MRIVITEVLCRGVSWDNSDISCSVVVPTPASHHPKRMMFRGSIKPAHHESEQELHEYATMQAVGQGAAG